MSTREVEVAIAIARQRDDALARLAAAEARVADLEAGIRRLCDEAEPVILATDDPMPDRPVLAIAVTDLRALVGDETPGTGERDG